MPFTPDKERELERRLRKQTWVTSGILLALPIVLAIALSVISPSYMAPLVTTWTGVAILLLAVLLLGCAAVGFWLLQRWNVHPAKFPLMSLPILVVFIFPTLWIVLLGPAVVKLMSRR